MMTRRLFASLLGLAPIAAKADIGEGEKRKARSIAKLKVEGVPTIDHLPIIETEATSTRRAKEEVVRRTLATMIAAIKGETADQELIKRIINQLGAVGYFSPDEQAFIDKPEVSSEERTKFAWRYEGVYVFLWSLGIAKDLPYPDKICDVSWMAATLREMGSNGLRAKANLRSQVEILDQADLIYRYDWACVNARIKGQEAPAGLDAGVVYERHYALNWLVGYSDQAWDDISTDT